MVASTERVVRICGAIMIAGYSQHLLWYVTPDVIAFARRLGIDMAVVLGSRVNVRELLKTFEVIDSTHFGTLPNEWRERTVRSADYHASCTGADGEFIYYVPSKLRKLDAQTAKLRAPCVEFAHGIVL